MHFEFFLSFLSENICDNTKIFLPAQSLRDKKSDDQSTICSTVNIV